MTARRGDDRRAEHGHFERAGRALSAWNDRRARHDAAKDATLRWRLVDRLAGWLYTRGHR